MVTDRKDGEKLSVIVLVFGSIAILTALNLFYSDWKGMWDSVWHLGAIAGAIGHALVLVFGCLAVTKWDDPQYDKYRISFTLVAIISLLLVCGFKVTKIENISVIEDSNKAKQEQVQ